MYTLVEGQGRSVGTEMGVSIRWALEAGAPGPSQLTAQPTGGVAPVCAHAPGTAECCISLQALAEVLGAFVLAAIADAGVEEGARWDEAVALSEDPTEGGGHAQELSVQQGAWARGAAAQVHHPKAKDSLV